MGFYDANYYFSFNGFVIVKIGLRCNATTLCCPVSNGHVIVFCLENKLVVRKQAGYENGCIQCFALQRAGVQFL